MAARNPGIDLDLSWVDSVRVNKPAVFKRANEIRTRRAVKKNYQVAWLLKAATCIDLTTLSGDDTVTNVQRLCFKAKNPVRRDLLEAVQMQHRGLTVGAVCVYPSRVSDAVNALKQAGAPQIPVASVATGFPAGQTPFKTRLAEIQMAVSDGAKEIDIVINRAYALAGDWKGVYDEVRAFREACGEAHLKTILATGELGTLVNVYKASLVCMMAGSDFIKTSTGKEGVNAILPVGLVMVRAIRDYYQRTGHKSSESKVIEPNHKVWSIVLKGTSMTICSIKAEVGFKPAGGIRTAKDSCTWLSLMKEELGNDWLTPELFRIGASSLLGDIERQIYHNVTGRYAAANELAMA